MNLESNIEFLKRELSEYPILDNTETLSLFQNIEIFNLLKDCIEEVGDQPILSYFDSLPRAESIIQPDQTKYKHLSYTDEIIISDLSHVLLSKFNVIDESKIVQLSESLIHSDSDLLVLPSKWALGRYILGKINIEGGDINKVLKQYSELAQISRDIIYKGNWGLTTSILRFWGNTEFADDLLQEANISLYKNIDKFDYRKGPVFSSYIIRVIYSSVKRESQKLTSMLAVSKTDRYNLTVLERLVEEEKLKTPDLHISHIVRASTNDLVGKLAESNGWLGNTIRNNLNFYYNLYFIKHLGEIAEVDPDSILAWDEISDEDDLRTKLYNEINNYLDLDELIIFYLKNFLHLKKPPQIEELFRNSPTYCEYRGLGTEIKFTNNPEIYEQILMEIYNYFDQPIVPPRSILSLRNRVQSGNISKKVHA